MKNIGITQCIIPLQSGEGHIPIFDKDFSIPKLKRMFSVDCFVDPLKELKIDYYKIVSKDLKSKLTDLKIELLDDSMIMIR